MFFQSKNVAGVKTNAFKNSVTVKQAMIEHGNLGLAFGIKFSVDITLRLLSPLV